MTQTWPMIMRRSASGYLFVQAIAGAVWWTLLLALPTSGSWFLPVEIYQPIMRSIALPDIVMFVGASSAAAIACRLNRIAVVATSIATGAAMYAALLSIGLAITFNDGWLGALLMIFSALFSGGALLLAIGHPWVIRRFRVSARRSRNKLIVMTLGQILVVWLTLLFVIPAGLAWAESNAGIPAGNASVVWRVISIMVFGLGSALGITSAWHMVVRGHGTPLPSAAAAHFVASGPYAYIRNPMAVGGLVQGTAVALWLASPTIGIYVLFGAVIWHVVVRPLEEFDLHNRFGALYVNYCNHVKCWWPRLRSVNAD